MGIESKIINDGAESDLYLSEWTSGIDRSNGVQMTIDFNGNRGTAILGRAQIQDLMSWCIRWLIADSEKKMETEALR